MADAADSYRLAIAALEVPDPVRHAIDELCANDVSTHQLCLAGKPGTVETMRSTLSGKQSPADGALSLLLAVEPFDMVGNTMPIVATSGRLLTTLANSTVLSIAGTTNGNCWLPHDMRSRLFDRMISGDALLMAGPLSREQWIMSTRVLLRHSRHPVQSHEFMKAPRP